MRASWDRRVEEMTPEGVNVRTTVHEYGGGDYRVVAGRVFYVDFSDQQVYVCGPAGSDRHPRPISRGSSRYADIELSPNGRWLVAVEECSRAGAEPENRLVVLSANGDAAARIVATGRDFYAFPRFSPDGRRLAFTAWDHPHMPWDAAALFIQDWDDAGPTGTARKVAGGNAESIDQPRFSPAGVLTFVSDRSGWWNLYQLGESEDRAVCARQAEFGRPMWVFGNSSFAFRSEWELLCVYTESGCDHLAHLNLQSGELRRVELPYTAYEGIQVAGDRACFIAAGSTTAPAVIQFDLASHEVREVRSSISFEVDPGQLSIPETIAFPSSHGRTAHAFYYPPTHSQARPMAGERPPLRVKSHGGPTAATSPSFNAGIQYWTSRGFGVVDVNYTGSTGYGRAYREALKGQWGIVDVEDCIHAARFAVDDGRVDRDRLTISGGSAGGYTTLCALTFHDVFRAGASHYGIGDLEALTRGTHKFESRYLDSLIGSYPERRDLYRKRSPIHFPDQLNCPVAFFQGLEDQIVPPCQAEAMVAALARRGIPHAYVAFPGEQHGFRRAENICTALDGELYFYAQIFGFEVERCPPEVVIKR